MYTLLLLVTLIHFQMSEPIQFPTNSVEEKASSSEDEVFLDAKEDFECKRHVKNKKSDTINIDPINNVVRVKNCSGNNLIDLKLLPTDPKPKRIVNDTFIIDEPYVLIPQVRHKLPGMVTTQRFSIWSYIKEFVGKDLTRISLPVSLNEPLSFLHRPLDIFSYPELLQKIIQPNTDHVSRLEYIAANFAISQCSQSYRFFKPFNPLLGETYEIRNDEKGFVFVTEQVSHHPPIMGMFYMLPNLRGHASIKLGIKFWGNSADSVVEGHYTYEFLDQNGEVESVVTLEMPTTSGRNVIFGQLWMEKHGLTHIINHTTGHRLFFTYKKKSWFSNRGINAIEGLIVDKNGKELRYIYGHWTTDIWSCSPETYKRILENPSLSKGPDSKLLAKAIPREPNSEQYFNLPLNALTFNEFREGMYLPRTDVRYRPDIRCLENGDLNGAAAEKHRLEEKQRATRKKNEASGEKWVPLWFDFKPNPILKQDEWQFNLKYFEQNFDKCPDIY